MEYIKLFQNHSQYESYAGGVGMLKPNVSHCINENEVHYNPRTWADEYLTFDILSGGTIRWGLFGSGAPFKVISYSLDGGETWIAITSNGTSFNVSAGDKVLFKGDNSAYGVTTGGNSFGYSSASFNIKGNIMSLISGDSFVDATSVLDTGKGDNCTFVSLFTRTKVVNAENLVLPSSNVTGRGYYGMFEGCTSLITAPKILPPTALKNECYYLMFNGCTSLTTAPELPATTLARYCYSSMFAGCTSLTTAPELPATTLAERCYYYMFYGCTNLNYIKAMFTTTPSNTYTQNWVSGVAASGTFVKNSAAEWDVSGVNGIPTGWTVQTASE